MVTLQTADNALKNFYLDAVTEQIDSKISPFLAKIEKSSAYVTGKGVSKLVRTGVNGGISAGTETGDLPTAKSNDYVNFVATLKNLYGTIEITDKAIRASANSEGAFVNLLNDEMQALIKSAKHNFSRMLFGDGSGKIANVVTAKNAVVTLDSVVGLEEGMTLDFYNGSTLVQSEKKILVVDREAKTVMIEGATYTESTFASGTYVVVAGTALNCEITGLNAIFSNKALYGVARSKSIMKPYRATDVGAITEAIIQKAIDSIEERGCGKVNMILCSRGVRRALVEHCREKQIVLSTTTIGEDTSVMTFNGIPVVTDDFCPNGFMYLLNTNHFKLYQLCDWQWMEGEDGKILKQVAGKPIYTATLVKYAELLCECPCGQGMLVGITEA